MKKSLVVTALALVVVALGATAAMCALGAVGGSHQTCGKVDPAALRQAGAPGYAEQLERLARCQS
jgi:hypothetical protein